MASSSSTRQYDVFLNFRGEDTRKKFVSHLYSRLQDKGIHAFKDDSELPLGGSLPYELRNAIQESTFAVVVISQNYASSRWCLDELQIIMELHKKGTLKVVPIFYEVDPSDVRNQRASFKEAFKKHQGKEGPEKIQKWREALADVANLTGVDSRNWKDEATMVYDIVEDILERLLSMCPEDTSHIIGMDAHFKMLDPFLSMEYDDEARKIGIWGVGGIGKTTIARCLYDKLRHQFPFHCFIENIKKIYSVQGRRNLQEKFLSRILCDENLKIQNCEVDNILKARLGRAKVLAILDDVDELDQIQALAKETDWFGPGSIIIITTRDKGLLASHEIKLVYEVKCLDDDAACRLFSHFALGKSFGKGQLPDNIKELSIRASKAVQGIPLALKVLGSFLRGKKVKEWEAAISKLRGSPRKTIMASLKVSYDGLDEQSKAILLTVACLFIEERVSRLSRLLDGAEGEVEESLNMLADQALIDISYNGQVTMHDLIRELAEEIVYKESPNNPGRRRFLWDAKEIYNVLEDRTGTDAIEGISLNMDDLPKCPTRSGALVNMPNLKFLRIRNTLSRKEDLLGIRAAFNHFPRKLRLLDWKQCPLKSLPTGSRAEYLLELHLPRSDLETLSEGTLMLDTKGISAALETLILRHCKLLTKIPTTIGNLVTLKQLDLRWCKRLENIPDTIGRLTALETLKLSGCILLTKIPTSIGNLSTLKQLDLRWCKRLENIPSTIGKLTAIETLKLSSCILLTKIPTSIGNLSTLKQLDLLGCERLENIPNTIGNLTALESLLLAHCHRLLEIPTTIGNLTALKRLDLKGCERLYNIPDTIGKLTALKQLYLGKCRRLEEIPDTIGGLTALENLILDECNSLSKIPTTIGNLANLKLLSLGCCWGLKNIPDTIGKLTALECLILYECNWLLKIPTTIGNLAALKLLDLGCCQRLKNIPYTIGKLTALERLSLRCCIRLLKIPSSIGNLSALQVLDLCGCVNLENVPSTIGDCPALTNLDLGNCENLQNIPDTIGKLTALKEIYLVGCQNLGSIPSAIRNLPAHTIL